MSIFLPYLLHCIACIKNASGMCPTRIIYIVFLPEVYSVSSPFSRRFASSRSYSITITLEFENACP